MKLRITGSSEEANIALEAIKSTIDFDIKRGIGLQVDEDKVRRFILEAFPGRGRSPTAEEISESTELPGGKVKEILDLLNEKDIIYLKPGTHEIEGAYPFSNSKTLHHVKIKDNGAAFAMCAIDALGIPFMFDSDSAINSFCSQCGEPMHVEIKNGAIDSEDETTLVWIGTKRCGPAATSICKTLLFLCSKEHLKEWKKQNPDEGMALSLSEALYVGREIFKDFLKELNYGQI